MAKYGVRVPPGIACKTPDEVAAAAARLGGDSGEVVVKSQVSRPLARRGVAFSLEVSRFREEWAPRRRSMRTAARCFETKERWRA